MLEAHFGIPMTGAVLVPINPRLDAAGITFILGHCETNVLLVDRALSGLAARAVAALDRPPAVLDVDDSEYTGPASGSAPRTTTRARHNGREGVRYLLEDRVTVIDPATGDEVPADRETDGETVFRGNITMMRARRRAPTWSCGRGRRCRRPS